MNSSYGLILYIAAYLFTQTYAQSVTDNVIQDAQEIGNPPTKNIPNLTTYKNPKPQIDTKGKSIHNEQGITRTIQASTGTVGLNFPLLVYVPVFLVIAGVTFLSMVSVLPGVLNPFFLNPNGELFSMVARELNLLFNLDLL